MVHNQFIVTDVSARSDASLHVLANESSASRRKVPRGVAIPAARQQGIVDFLIVWIGREMKF